MTVYKIAKKYCLTLFRKVISNIFVIVSQLFLFLNGISLTNSIISLHNVEY